MENSIQNTIWTIRIYGPAIRTNKRTCYVAKMDQLHTKRISRYVLFSVPRRYSDLLKRPDTTLKGRQKYYGNYTKRRNETQTQQMRIP